MGRDEELLKVVPNSLTGAFKSLLHIIIDKLVNCQLVGDSDNFKMHFGLSPGRAYANSCRTWRTLRFPIDLLILDSLNND